MKAETGRAAGRRDRPKRARTPRGASVETLPVTWRTQAKALRRYGGETPAVALESCATAGQLRAGVEVLRGDPHRVAAVADALAFEHKYTSGVIAWAPDDAPTDAQIGAVLDSFERTAWAGLEARPLRLVGRGAPRARRRRPRARPRRAVRPGDRPQPEHRAARLAEDLRPAARRLQPRARLEPPGRPGAGQGAATGPSRLHRGVEAAGRPRARSRPARVDPRLPGAARRERRGAKPRRRGLRPGGSRLRGAAPGQELRDRPRSGWRKAVAAERSAVRA